MVNERIREYGKKSQRGRKKGGKQEGNTKLHEQRSSQPAERSRALWGSDAPDARNGPMLILLFC